MASVVCIGSGGNIGSHLVPLLARNPAIERITIVDPDVYERANVRGQAIRPADVGRRKVDVQSELVHSIAPHVVVDPIAERCESVPLGRLRADVVLTALDSRASRMAVNRIAWRLGRPWVDAGVRADAAMVRVDVFSTRSDSACYQCGWGADDYALVATRHPCRDAAGPASTQAPAELGALAASLAAAECNKLIGEQSMLLDAQLTLETQGYSRFVSAHRRDAQCRFDHRTWHIEQLPDSATRVGDVPGLADASAELSRDDDVFVRRLMCTGCGQLTAHTGPAARAEQVVPACIRCGRPRVAAALFNTQTLTCADRDLPFRAAGLTVGDVVTASGVNGERHFEITHS